MRHRFLLLFACALLASTPAVLAQSSKKVAAVAPFTYSTGSVSKQDAEGLSAEIEAIFSSSGRFENVARNKTWDLLVRERELQKGEAFIDGKVVEQGASIGAEILIVGHVIMIDRSGKCGSNPVIHLTAVDMATGKIIASDVVSKTGRSQVPVSDVRAVANDSYYLLYNDYGTYRKMNAIASGMEVANCITLASKNALRNKVTDYLDEYFPIQLTMFDFETDGDKVKGFLIEGSESMFKKGQLMDVVEESEVKTPSGVKKRKEVIAKAKIAEFQGEVIRCKVIEGGDKLFQKKDSKNVFLTTK